MADSDDDWEKEDVPVVKLNRNNGIYFFLLFFFQTNFLKSR
jgi:hypothetical protein